MAHPLVESSFVPRFSERLILFCRFAPNGGVSDVRISCDNDAFEEIFERKCIEEAHTSEVGPSCGVAFVEFADRDRMQGFSEWSLVLKDDVG
jgi:hypothetical protein